MQGTVAATQPGRSTLVADLSGGLLVAAITIPYTISVAALLFSGPLAARLDIGVSLVLLTAVIGSVGSAALGTYRFAIGAPDANSTAILAVMLGTLSARLTAQGAAADILPNALLTIFLATLATAVVLLTLGLLKMGRWVRYIPYPVMGGFLAATGWLLCLGALSVCLGEDVSWQALIAHGVDLRLLAGVVVAALLIGAGARLRTPLGMPVILVAAAAGLYGALWAAGLDIGEMRAGGWLFELAGQTRLSPPWQLLVEGKIHWDLIAAQSPGIAAVVAVAAITSLLEPAGVEVATEQEVDLDKELRAGGATNILTALSGGCVSLLAISPTLIVYRTGGRTRVAGVLVAAVCAAMLLGGLPIVGYLPRAVLGGFLLAIGFSLIDEWILRGSRKMPRGDFGIVLLILGMTVYFGFALGTLAGLLAASAAFAYNYARTSVIRRELGGHEIRSSFERAPDDRAVLDRAGHALRVLQLRGFIFFGSAHAIQAHLREQLAGPEPPRWLVLDFHDVQGLDSSAAMTFQKIVQLADRSGATVVFVGLGAEPTKRLRQAGCLDGRNAEVFGELDAGVEWCEDRILAENAATGADRPSPLDAWLAQEFGDARHVVELKRYASQLAFEPGQELFRQGDASDALFMLETGRVSVILETPQGPKRLRSFLGGTVVGEMGLYTSDTRSATVVADERSVALRLGLADLERLQRDNPALAGEVHRAIVRLLAKRLAQANAENAALWRSAEDAG